MGYFVGLGSLEFAGFAGDLAVEFLRKQEKWMLRALAFLLRQRMVQRASQMTSFAKLAHEQ